MFFKPFLTKSIILLERLGNTCSRRRGVLLVYRNVQVDKIPKNKKKAGFKVSQQNIIQSVTLTCATFSSGKWSTPSRPPSSIAPLSSSDLHVPVVGSFCTKGQHGNSDQLPQRLSPPVFFLGPLLVGTYHCIQITSYRSCRSWRFSYPVV